MRWLFILFLLLNVIYLGRELNRQFKMDRLNNPPSVISLTGLQKLKLISESDVELQIYQPDSGQFSVSNESTESKSIFALADNQLVTDLPDITSVNLGTGSANMFCYTFGPIEEESLAIGVEDWFNSRRAKTNVKFTDERGKQLFWIYLEPYGHNNDAMSIIKDLDNKGIKDYRLISKVNLQNAISLGLYSSQAAVNNRLMELKEKGYKPIIMPYNDGKRVYWVDVQLSVEPVALDAVFNGYPSRYNYVPVDCSKIAILSTNP